MSSPQYHCPHFSGGLCHSCQYSESLFQASQRDKIQLAQKLLNFSCPSEMFTPTLENSLGSRTKIKYAIGQDPSGRPQLAIPQFSKKYTLLNDCPLHHPRLNEISEFIEKSAPQIPLSAYNLETQKGEWKYLHLGISPDLEVMVTFVLRSKEAKERVIKYCNEILIKKFPEIKIMAINFHPEHQALSLGTDFFYITETQTIKYRLNDAYFLAGVENFVQAHFQLAKELYLTAHSWLSELNLDLVIDIFCGTGAFSLLSTPKNIKILGLELNQNSVDLALQASNLQRGLENANYKQANAYESPTINFDNFLDPNKANHLCMIVNPPRRGLGPMAKEITQKHRPPHLIYSSCHPGSLALDLQEILKFYRPVKVKYFDIFPFTNHLECMVQFTLL